MNLPIFKIRASAASEILAGQIGLSDAQQIKYDGYVQRLAEYEAGDPKKKLTQNMEDEFASLKYKLNNPELPQGAKTYCEKWLKEQLYDRRKNFANKYLEKGIACEDDSIAYASENLGWGGVSKNEEWFSDDWMEGTPDIITELQNIKVGENYKEEVSKVPTVIDMKNVWDCFTMPLFEPEIPTPAYETQLQVYMELVSNEYKVDFNQAILCYALMDAPLSVMKKEMYRLSWEEGQQGLITDEIGERVHKEMSYSNLGPDLRLKTYQVSRNPEVIAELRLRVEMCRKYIGHLVKNKRELLLAA